MCCAVLYFGTVHGHGKRLAGVSGYVSLASIVPGASFLGVLSLFLMAASTLCLCARATQGPWDACAAA